MATLYDLQPHPYVLLRNVVEIDLVQALPEDLKTFDKYDNQGQAVFKIKEGLVYWLQSEVTGKIEPTPRKLTAQCNLKEIATWLDHKMIWISKISFLG